ncbi:MAG: beta-lactamase family protein, partial [Alphaproteobacteria bacterium]|nr:beta-lactamase family protein [Alphaproteobacteria bacterium]
PMPKDAIFRIYSMTKPITSIAALMLIEEGKMSLGDPVSRWLPELAKREVASQAAGQANLERRAAKGEITVQDLLRHTSGFTYGVFGDTAVHKLYREGKVEEVDASNAEFVSRIAKMPLRNDPGTVWEYSRSTDVLGRLVEVVSGEKLSAFVARRITGPLGMKDTAFHVQPENLARLAEPQINPRNGKRDAMLDVTKPPVYEAGGQGMVSTAADYARFAQFLLNKGELDGVRLVSRKTIENMTANHLSGAVFRASGGEPIGPGYGFGLGVGVRMAGGIAPLPGSRGDFYWGGFGGTYFWVDPKEDLIAIYMMQDIAGRTHYRAVMRNLVYPALAD